MAFPTETVSVVPADVSVDHALAGRGDRYEHHFFVACRTTRENRWDAARRFAYCRHARISLIPVCLGCPITTGVCNISSGSGRRFFKLKLGHCENQIRPLRSETGQYPDGEARSLKPRAYVDKEPALLELMFSGIRLPHRSVIPSPSRVSGQTLAVALSMRSHPGASWPAPLGRPYLKAGVHQSLDDDLGRGLRIRDRYRKVVAVEQVDEHVLRGEFGRDR